MKKILLRKRIKSLLENKNNNFKRKFFLLSLNPLLKENNNDKFLSYVDVLFKSNGNYPKEDALDKYLKESKLSNKKITYIKNYLNILYSNRKNIVESIIDDELSSINDNNKILDLKLKESLITLNNKKISLFLESNDFDDIEEEEDFDETVDTDIDDDFIDDDFDINDIDLDDIDISDLDIDNLDLSDLEVSDEELEFLGIEKEVFEKEVQKSIRKQEKIKRTSGYKKLIQDYDWLFKVSKIPFIRNKLKIYIPTDFNQEEIDKKIPPVDKLAIIKNYDLKFNKNASDKDLRKLEIISFIDYYLNVKQTLIKNSEMSALTQQINDSDSVMDKLTSIYYGSQLDKDVLLKIKKAKATSSYIEPAIKNKLKEIRKNIINKGIFEENNINLDNISEDELFNLLNACLSRDDEKFYSKPQRVGGKTIVGKYNVTSEEGGEIVKDEVGEKTIDLIKKGLDAKYGKKTSEPFKPQDKEEYEQYLLDKEEYEKQLKSEEEEESRLNDDFMTAEEAEAAESDPNTYPTYKPRYKKIRYHKKNPKTGELFLDKETNKPKVFEKFAEDDDGNKVIKDFVKVYDEKGEPVVEIEVERPEVIDLTKGFSGTKKQRLRRDIDTLIDSAATPAEMFNILQNYNNSMKDAKSYKDIAKLSQGYFRDAPGSRQFANKAWFKALFFTSDYNQLSNIYEKILEKYIDIIKKKDLFKNIIDSESMKFDRRLKFNREDIESQISKDDISAYFQKDLKLIATSGEEIDKEDIEDYFSGQYDYDVLAPEEEVKKQLLDSLLESDSSVFRHFSTSIMKDFYDKRIWSGLELELAHGVVEYFKNNKKFTKHKIGFDLPANKKSNKVKEIQGKILFNAIIYWVMRRTGVSTKDTGMFNVQQDKIERANKFKKGFAKSIDKFNQVIDVYNEKVIDDLLKREPGKVINKVELLKDGTLKHNFVFTESDFNDLINDMSSDSGILGGIYAKRRKLDKNTYDSFLKYIEDKSDVELSRYIDVSLVTSFYHKEGFILKSITKGNKTHIFLVKKNDPNKMHLLSQQELDMMNVLATDISGITDIDIEAYKRSTAMQYKNSMTQEELEDWLEEAYECNYFDLDKGKLYKNAEIVDVDKNFENVFITLNPDSDNPEDVWVTTEFITEA